MDNNLKQVNYRTFSRIRSKSFSLNQLRSFYFSSYERIRRNKYYDNPSEKKIKGVGIGFNSEGFRNRISIGKLSGISLQDWLIFLKDVNGFFVENLGPKNDFTDKITKFEANQGAFNFHVQLEYAGITSNDYNIEKMS